METSSVGLQTPVWEALKPAKKPPPPAKVGGMDDMTYRQKMREASKDVAIVLAKIKEGLGDMFKMKAATLLVRLNFARGALA